MLKWIFASLTFLLSIYGVLSPVRVMAQTPTGQVSFNSPLYSVAWSPDGSALAVAGADGIRLYTPSLQETAHVAVNESTVKLSWSPDSTRVVSTSEDSNQIRIWQRDSSTNTLTLSDTVQVSHQSAITAAWSPVENRIALIGEDLPEGNNDLIGTIEIWQEVNAHWQLQKTLETDLINRFPLRPLVWSPDGTLISGIGNGCVSEACGNGQRSFVYTINVDTGNNLTLFDFNSPPTTLAWSVNNQLAIGEEVLTIVNPQSGLKISEWKYPDPNADFTSSDWDAAGRRVAVGSLRTGLISIVDMETSVLLQSFTGGGDLTSLDWSPDNSKLATVNESGELKVWDTSNLPDATGSPTVTPYETLSPSPTP